MTQAYRTGISHKHIACEVGEPATVLLTSQRAALGRAVELSDELKMLGEVSQHHQLDDLLTEAHV